MCYRVSLKAREEQIRIAFRIDDVPADFEPRYNIGLTQPMLTVAERVGKRQAAMLRFGLVPHWSKDLTIGSKLGNARSETVEEKPSFREAFKKRRCLIVVDGFYEWQTEGKRKIPSYFHLADDGPFSFAGLWETWSKDGSPVSTCAILTTGPNELMAPIHNRMPVILPSEDRDLWLDPEAPPEALKSILRPYEGSDLEVYRVSTYVNNVRNEGPECTQPA